MKYSSSFALFLVSSLSTSSSALLPHSSSTDDNNEGRVLKLVRDINSVQTSWTAGISDRLGENATYYEHIKDLCGTTHLTGDAGFDALEERESFPLRGTPLPDHFDSRTAFPGCEKVISHVRDQSNCGSCWAFATAEAFTDRRCVAHGDQTYYSAEDVLSCCSGIGCGFSKGCNGGQPTSAWKWISRKGVVSGGDESSEEGDSCAPYPFQACAHHVDSDVYKPCGSGAEFATPKCTSTCSDSSYKTPYARDKTQAKEAYSITGVEKIMEEIVTNGPVTAAFTVYDDFPLYQSGVYVPTTHKKLGGHAIEIVGFGIEDDVKYWLVKNSWNDTWGDGGFFKIKRGSNTCGIEGTVSAGIV